MIFIFINCFVKGVFYNKFFFFQIFFFKTYIVKKQKKNEDKPKKKYYCEEEKKVKGKTGINEFDGYILSFNLTHDIDKSLEVL